MNSNALTFLRSKTCEDLVVEFNETAQQISRGIEFERQSGFCEIDLNTGSPSIKCAADVSLRLGLPDLLNQIAC